MKTRKLILTIVCALIVAVSISQGGAAEKAVGTQPADQLDSAALVVEKIDINQADQALLTKLPGIGSSTAEKITAYRDVNGPFESIDDLLNVKGIGPEKLEKIKPLVTLS